MNIDAEVWEGLVHYYYYYDGKIPKIVYVYSTMCSVEGNTAINKNTMLEKPVKIYEHSFSVVYSCNG